MKGMKKSVLSLSLAVMVCLSAVVIDAGAQADAATAEAVADYYASITATGGAALLGQVHDLITTTHTKYTTYDDCKNPTYVRQTDPDGTGELLEFYAQATLSSTWQSGATGTWNREHVWCQSLSNGLWGTTGGGSDLYHIRPTESRVNSARNNNKYGISSTKTEVRYRDAGNTQDVLAGYRDGTSVFEPIDSVKGDVARIVMYVYTHYNTYENVSGTTNGNGSSSYFGTLKYTNVMAASSEAAAIEMLLEWNESDPVDAVEIARNEAVYEIQGNRNPFVDHPEYADAIWGESSLGPAVELERLTLSKTAFTLTEGRSETLTVSAYPAGASASVEWSSSNEAVVTVSADGKVTAISAGEATVTATSKVNPSVKATAQVTVEKSGFKTVTVTLDSFDLTTGYGFKSWTEGELGGTAYIYGGSSAYPASSGMQFNKNQASYYFASSTAAEGGIRSITVKSYEGTADRDWKLLTSDMPYGEVAGKPTNGNDHGTKTVTSDGVMWTLDGSDTYFALTYEFPTSGTSAAAYLGSIVIEYGEGSVEIPSHEHVDADSDGRCDVCDEELGGTQQSGDDVDGEAVVQFHEAVGSIVAEGALSERYASLSRAITAYQALSEAEKAAAQADVDVLLAAIADYNKAVNAYNEDAEKSNKAARNG